MRGVSAECERGGLSPERGRECVSVRVRARHPRGGDGEDEMVVERRSALCCCTSEADLHPESIRLNLAAGSSHGRRHCSCMRPSFGRVRCKPESRSAAAPFRAVWPTPAQALAVSPVAPTIPLPFAPSTYARRPRVLTTGAKRVPPNRSDPAASGRTEIRRRTVEPHARG